MCASRPVIIPALIIGLTIGTCSTPLCAQGNRGQQPYPAPRLTGGQGWINSSYPIRLADLRGKVVLLDFWTYCCINCFHILPTLKRLEEKYPNELVVIGVHSPKFTTEKSFANVRRAVLRYHITHPVLNDANQAVWRRYNVNFWPTMFLINPEGQVCAWRSGEVPFEALDSAIAQQIRLHRKKGTLNRRPINWDLEQSRQDQTPLRFPGKIIVNENGRKLLIADSGNHRIVITDTAGRVETVIGAGKPGRADGAFSTASFNDPQGIVLSGNRLFVADNSNHLIREANLEKEIVTTIAGTGKMLSSYESLHKFSTRPRTYRLSNPWDLTLVNRQLYIAMAGTHQLAVYDLVKKTIRPYSGNGVEDVRDGTLSNACHAQPSGLATDGRVLFVVDSEGSSLRAVSLPPGNAVTTVVGTTGLPKFKSLFAFGDKDGRGPLARLQHPIGVAYADGSVYVADTYNHKVKLVNPVARTSVTLAGNRRAGSSLQPLELYEPAGLAAFGQTLYIADTNNHRIVTLDLKSEQASSLTMEGLQPPAAGAAVSAEN